MHTNATEQVNRSGLVLMFHGIDPGDGRFDNLSAGERAYTVSLEKFREYLRLIEASSYTITSPSESQQPRAGELWLTFDDGWSSDFDVVFPILQNRGYQATFFITTDWIESKGHLDRDALRTMRETGMLIGSHGHSHAMLGTLNDTEQKYEMTESRRILKKYLGEDITTISLPGGNRNGQTFDIARESGYRSVFTSRPGEICSSDELQVSGRIAVRAKDDENFIRELLSSPEAVIKKMQRTERWKSALRKVLGARLYAWLHNLFTKISGGRS